MPVFSYIDENEQLRGPFEGVQMHYWYLKGYLPPTLHIFVHYGLYGRSTTLEELRIRNGDLNPLFEVVNFRRGNPYEPLSSNSNSHSSLSYGLENVRKTRELPGEAPLSEDEENHETMVSKEDPDKQFYCDICDVKMPRALMFEHCTTKEHSGKCVVEALDVLEEMRLYNESDECGATEAASNIPCKKDNLFLNGSNRAFSPWNTESWTRTVESVHTMDDNVPEKRKEENENKKYLSRLTSSSKKTASSGKERYYDYRKDCAMM